MPVTVKTQSRSAAMRQTPLTCLGLWPKKTETVLSPSEGDISLQPLPTTSAPLFFVWGTSAKSAVSHTSSSFRSQRGFTLVEIVVVVVILSIFAGMMSLSVGSSESRKNRAFYEHLIDSLSYVRLLSAERMQPMGLSLQANKQGQVVPVIVSLSNAYSAYQVPEVSAASTNDRPKNAMELSADISSMTRADSDRPTPSWEIESEVSLPELPDGVSVSVQSLDTGNIAGAEQGQTLQPVFAAQSAPQVLWFGTGQAAPVTIEVRHNARLVGEVITLMPDGSLMIGQEM